MKANELLLWLSARRQGSWQQFRAAVEELHSNDDDSAANMIASIDESEFPLHQRFRLDLERLAHVEFFTQSCEKGWRVAPPMLAAHPLPGRERAVLCGARSPALCERVHRAIEEFFGEVVEIPGVPDMIRLAAPDISTIAEIAKRAGVYFQADAPLAILSHLSPCDPPSRTQRPSEFPVGADWHIRAFDETALSWHNVDRKDAEQARVGAFCFAHRFQRPSYFLRWAGATFRLPRAIVIYVLLQRGHHNLLYYDAAAQALSLPAICQPPRLLERALVLCSGLPPTYDPATARLTYVDVPLDVAEFAGALLRQVLQ